MKFLVVTVIYLLSGCGSFPAPHGETQVARSARLVADKTRLLMRRVSPNMVVGKVVHEGMVGGKIIPRNRKYLPIKELVATNTPTEWLFGRNKPHAVLQKIKLVARYASLEEARQHIEQRETFFHIFFTMRDSVGGDMELFSKLNPMYGGKDWSMRRNYGAIEPILAVDRLNVSVDTYFDLVQRPRFPEEDELQQIIAGVAGDKNLRENFLSDLLHAASIELAIEKGLLYHHIGDRGVRNVEINASLRQRLHDTYDQAARDVQLNRLRQSELKVQSWLRQGSTVNELLLQMQELAGGSEKLAALLNMQERHLRYCIRYGAREVKTITNIITKLHRLDSSDMIKSFADELDASLAMERAIDAGTVVPFGFQRNRIIPYRGYRNIETHAADTTPTPSWSSPRENTKPRRRRPLCCLRLRLRLNKST